MCNDDRRLIEDYLPIEAISKEASREKSVRKGHISTLHLWWARRPLVACRAAVYGALVPANRFRPKNGPEEKLESLTRANAARFVDALCKYPGDPQVIAQAQQHILEAHAERLSQETGKPVTAKDIEQGRAPRPKVLDMFAGGGAIPLEALRLGCEAYALELNPVAHIIELCTLVYPQKYGKPDPGARGMTGPKNEKGETTWGGLAEEVRHWGNWVLKKVKAEIGDLYAALPDPKALKTKLPSGQAQLDMTGKGFDYKGQQRFAVETSAGYLTPVAYLWTRTVRCKKPSCGATVPLVKQTWLCKKKDRHVALKIVAPNGKKHVRFEVAEATNEQGLRFDPAAFSKGGNATCPFCGTVADSDFVKTEGCAGRLGQQMMAIVCVKRGKEGKIYLSADDYPHFVPNDEAIRKRIETLSARSGFTVPNEPIITDAKNSYWTHLYGLTTFGHLFTPRQMLCLLTFGAVIREAAVESSRLNYDRDHAVAVTTFLGVILDRLADFNSTGCTWNYTGGRGVLHTMARQAIPMAWDFAETNPFNPNAASWVTGIDDVPAAIEEIGETPSTAVVARGSATRLPWDMGAFDVVVTDPPYYDNVPYADISDFFYVWLKRTIGATFPDHFAGEGTPKKTEIVADAVRHAGDPYAHRALRVYRKPLDFGKSAISRSNRNHAGTGLPH